ncbi:succinate semialdehyde dehydrogenase [Tistlia consotensis]|uniref:Succinate semialdehyde dehydrogenase n=1 Tax=Tistlia consotensis USBA 355 TaxID=560819 RepID=A0A1Y6CCE3_9PROT|nr:NAD-dependent succinate-semialdehyde dehydrogenase [Tistlia consotensis]SMF56733.1 succinate semialdehyde dehydrogenase [Tistlia consotensis USBA 355]SNR44972.1 succinate semialdehyde dehydrogenase [Tistlia consotensis]
MAPSATASLRSVPAPARAGGQPDLADRRLFRELSYIGGRWTAAGDAGTLEVLDPADGCLVGRVPTLGAKAATAAVAAAQAAFPAWRKRLARERAELLRAWHALIVANRRDLALLMVAEQGKPLAEAEGEIDYAAGFLAWYAEEAVRVSAESLPSHLPGAETAVRREPIGVAALVTPWNFPTAMITRKAAAALAAGCSVVVHPSSETPFSALALAELADRAGLPAGVFNVVTGRAAEIVPAWCADTRVRALSFNGSTEIGRLLAEQCAPTVKQLILELGGHAPFVVFADADLERAVESCLSAKFATSGQDCLAANRIYVERPVYQAFLARFLERVRDLKVGPGLEPGVEIGPLIHERALAKMAEQVEDATARGARLLLGGARHALGGCFFEPTVLADVPDAALVFNEETFGPIAALAPFDSEAEVLAKANATEYGLIAYLHSGDRARIARVVEALEYGMVAVNRTKVTGAPVPFGGVKQSGLAREGGRAGLEAFTELKYVCSEVA